MNAATRELVRYRLQEAHETLADARDLPAKGSTRSATNRVYYSMFYAALALLVTRGMSSSKHSGVISLFRKEFVKTGSFPADLAEDLDRAFDMRTGGDYREFVVPEPEAVAVLLDRAGTFIKQVERSLAEMN